MLLQDRIRDELHPMLASGQQLPSSSISTCCFGFKLDPDLFKPQEAFIINPPDTQPDHMHWKASLGAGWAPRRGDQALTLGAPPDADAAGYYTH